MQLIRRFQRSYRTKELAKKRQEWEAGGSTIPPPHSVKQLKVLTACKRHDILVETGTYMGEMIENMANFFREIYTIELSAEIYEKTSRRLQHLRNVHFYHGDSAKVLNEVVSSLSGPALFWLDGHYSGGITAKGDCDTPVIDELTAIAGSKFASQHAILIDDARCFAATNDHLDYPTITEIERLCAEHFPSHRMRVSDDVIEILSREGS